MPLYEYSCSCGRFESFRSDICPVCGDKGKRLISSPARIISKTSESLPLGNKSRGRFIPPSKDNMGILIPSFGALEKEEVDYLAEASLEKERDRKRNRVQKTALEKVTKVLMNTPQGKRNEMLNQITGG